MVVGGLLITFMNRSIFCIVPIVHIYCANTVTFISVANRCLSLTIWCLGSAFSRWWLISKPYAFYSCVSVHPKKYIKRKHHKRFGSPSPFMVFCKYQYGSSRVAFFEYFGQLIVQLLQYGYKSQNQKLLKVRSEILIQT